MHLAFDIFQGLGIAAAVGVRPFAPALAVCALAAGNVEIHFNHTDYSFLQSGPFLLALAVLAILLLLAERQTTLDRGPSAVVLGLAGLALGALLFAGSLARGHYAVWPGFVAGVLCAAVGFAASGPLLRRVRARLDESGAATLPLYVEAAALLFAALSVVAPPVGIIVIASLAWLLWAGRRRDQQKYAGLRILR